MSASRTATTLFCDDIRHEVGNKYSLIGCYGSELLVEKLPLVLPKLCAHVRIITPIDKSFTNLKIRAYLNEDTIAEMNYSPEDIRKPESSLVENSIRAELNIMMVFSPLPITELSKLRIEAEADDDVLRGGILIIRENSSENNSSSVE